MMPDLDAQLDVKERIQAIQGENFYDIHEGLTLAMGRSKDTKSVIGEKTVLRN